MLVDDGVRPDNIADGVIQTESTNLDKFRNNPGGEEWPAELKQFLFQGNGTYAIVSEVTIPRCPAHSLDHVYV